MRVKRRLRIRWLSLFFLLVLPVVAYGGVPEVNHVMVTDVTTCSFSVIWSASEASTADLEVYEDKNGAVPIADAVIKPHPIECGNEQIRIMAEDQGVMKVRVTGLDPDTTYYFMTVTTSKSSTDTTYNPNAAPFTPVTTESETVRTYESGGDVLPFSNDLIIEPCYLDDGITFAEGTLLLATVAGGSHPITTFVGDGVELPYAIIDLNNVFSRDAHHNLDLLQGLNLTLLNFRGAGNSIVTNAGNSIVTNLVPEDQSLSEVKPAEFALKAGANFVSFQLEPGDFFPASVLDCIVDKVEVIWGKNEQGEWVFYDPEVPFETLNEIHSSTGYWLYMKDEASCLVNGTFRADPIQLEPGANLVGYRSIETIDVMRATASIHDQLEIIWTNHEGNWIFYDPDVPFRTLHHIEPGKAYWVYVNDYCEW